MKRGGDAAFLVSPELTDDDAIRMAMGLYALYMTVNFLRFAAAPEQSYDALPLLRLHAKTAVANHPAKRLLCY